MISTLLWLVLACDRTPGTSSTKPTKDDTPTTDSTSDPTSCDEDADGDGVAACDDCDDDDPNTFPGAVERCDGLDNDCDGAPHPDEALQDCAACDALGWWHPSRGVQGEALEELVWELTRSHTCFDYSRATDFLFLILDADQGEIECVYTGRRTSLASGKPDPADMNTEHSWPQSQGAGDEPARCDLHHLYPTDADTNNYRANLPFGEVVSDTQPIDGGSRLGLDASGVEVFEPRDLHKGNVARSMLYFAARYGYDLSPAEVTLYQAWHLLDPVDEREQERSLAIGDEQGAANPYVVCPWLVEALEP
ncbi:MAG TPA: hypothetical protein ENK18_15150 [Deltaproteobacteria bacterium]|nr:hypothetical protein [Deltaproteobacteria bacterium]